MVVYDLNDKDVYDVLSKYEVDLRYFDYGNGRWVQYVRYGELEIRFRGDGWHWRYCDIPMYCNNDNGDIEL